MLTKSGMLVLCVSRLSARSLVLARIFHNFFNFLAASVEMTQSNSTKNSWKKSMTKMEK